MIPNPTRCLALAILLALAGCADSQDPDPQPTQDEVVGGYDKIDPVVNPVAGKPHPPQDGEWVSGTVEGREAILFDPVEGEPIFAMFCDERDGIVLERRRLLPSGPYRMMDVTVGNDRDSFAANEVQGNGPVVRANIPFQTDLYTRLRRPVDEISISIGRSAPLVLPGGVEVAELVRTCTTAQE